MDLIDQIIKYNFCYQKEIVEPIDKILTAIRKYSEKSKLPAETSIDFYNYKLIICVSNSYDDFEIDFILNKVAKFHIPATYNNYLKFCVILKILEICPDLNLSHDDIRKIEKDIKNYSKSLIDFFEYISSRHIHFDIDIKRSEIYKILKDNSQNYSQGQICYILYNLIDESILFYKEKYYVSFCVSASFLCLFSENDYGSDEEFIFHNADGNVKVNFKFHWVENDAIDVLYNLYSFYIKEYFGNKVKETHHKLYEFIQEMDYPGWGLLNEFDFIVELDKVIFRNKEDNRELTIKDDKINSDIEFTKDNLLDNLSDIRTVRKIKICRVSGNKRIHFETTNFDEKYNYQRIYIRKNNAKN